MRNTSALASNANAITRVVQWIADNLAIFSSLSPPLNEIASRFDLTDADAAEAILLAGNYSICRRAFG